jgi:hypothetical protein
MQASQQPGLRSSCEDLFLRERRLADITSNNASLQRQMSAAHSEAPKGKLIQPENKKG